jgi:hypothetical protein
MLYSVLDAHGNRYGPVDLATLNQWVRDGRIVPSTQIVVESTQRVVAASMVPGLLLGGAPGLGPTYDPQAPIGFPGAQGGPSMMQGRAQYSSGAFSSGSDLIPGAAEYNRALLFAGIGFVTCLCVPPVAVFIFFPAIYYARAAQLKGHPSPGHAYLAAIAGLVLSILMTIVLFATINVAQGLAFS